MSIEKRTRFSFFCICDECGAEISGGTSFHDAVEARKREKWKSQKDASGEWIDICQACQKATKEAE